MLPHTPSNVVGNSIGPRGSSCRDALPEHAIEVNRGSVVLHHSLTVHYSDPNLSDRARRGLVYVYMSPGPIGRSRRMKGPAIFPGSGVDSWRCALLIADYRLLDVA